VQEFRVSSNTYGAELGRAGGAVVNVVTKSGSNHFHGTGFYFIRDSTFGAQPAFLDFKPDNRQQQFGGTIGGPIRSNRVFSFAGYDQHIFHVPTIVNFVSGGSVLVPQAGSGPLQPGDYEDNDKDLVFAAAAHLNQRRETIAPTCSATPASSKSTRPSLPDITSPRASTPRATTEPTTSSSTPPARSRIRRSATTAKKMSRLNPRRSR
jgi:hypothetical protein